MTLDELLHEYRGAEIRLRDLPQGTLALVATAEGAWEGAIGIMYGESLWCIVPSPQDRPNRGANSYADMRCIPLRLDDFKRDANQEWVQVGRMRANSFGVVVGADPDNRDWINRLVWRTCLPGTSARLPAACVAPPTSDHLWGAFTVAHHADIVISPVTLEPLYEGMRT